MGSLVSHTGEGAHKATRQAPTQQGHKQTLGGIRGPEHWWERRLGEVEGGDGWVKSGRLK